MVDDDEDLTRQVPEYLNEKQICGDESIQVITQNNFDEAINDLGERKIDLVILDVRLGAVNLKPGSEPEEAGLRVLKAIKEKKFVPIVFFTALPDSVRYLESPLIKVVEKGSPEQLNDLLESLNTIFSTPLPSVNRALISHLEAVQRDYMWDFISEHWDTFRGVNNHAELAYLLGRRLSISLSQNGIKQLLKDFPEPDDAIPVNGLIHPSQYYVIPPVEENPLAGDIYTEIVEEQKNYWILLTPSCDLVKRGEKQHAERILLARCLLLTEQKEFSKWQECCSRFNKTVPGTSRDTIGKQREKAEESLVWLLKNNRQKSQSERYFFLPGALGLPDLVVDFQDLNNSEREKLDEMTRVASLDSPFSEGILYRFARYYGRLGTPDLHIESVLSKMRQISINSN